MTLSRIPVNTLILVGDGRKALFLRNYGTALAPQLKVESVFSHDNPPMRAQVSDRAGRTISGPDHRRGSFEKGDWHEFEEKRFARTIAETLERFVRSAPDTDIIIVAPPRTLADLRKSWHQNVAERIISELPKDLTRHPVQDIAKHLIERQ